MAQTIVEICRRDLTTSIIEDLAIGVLSGDTVRLLRSASRLSAQLQHFAEVKWLLESGSIMILEELLHFRSSELQTFIVEMLAKTAERFCVDNAAEEVLDCVDDILHFIRWFVVGVPDRQHLAGPLYAALAAMSTCNTRTVRKLLMRTIPLSFLKTVEFGDVSARHREALVTAIINLLRPRTSKRDRCEFPSTALNVFERVCQPPGVNCATIAAICECITNNIPYPDRLKQVEYLSRTQLMAYVVKHVTNQHDTTCDGSCVLAVTSAVSKLFADADRESSLRFIAQSILEVVSLVLNNTAHNSSKAFAITVVLDCAHLGPAAIDSIVNHKLLCPLVVLLSDHCAALQSHAEQAIFIFMRSAARHQLVRVFSSELTEKFRECIECSNLRAVRTALCQLCAFVERCAVGHGAASIVDTMRQQAIHLSLAELVTSEDEDVKKQATKLSRYLLPTPQYDL